MSFHIELKECCLYCKNRRRSSAVSTTFEHSTSGFRPVLFSALSLLFFKPIFPRRSYLRENNQEHVVNCPRSFDMNVLTLFLSFFYAVSELSLLVSF